MLESAISDQKRIARGLHWERIQFLLRARDKTHHRAWRLLTIAGPVPHEEINCIRALMPRAHIISVDKDADNLERAIDAGADEVFHMDIGKFQQVPTGNRWGPEFKYAMPVQFEDQERFDAISLDLTGPADDWLRLCVRQYFSCGGLTDGGIMTVTFSYGRDVVEMYGVEWERITGKAFAEHKFDPVDFLEPIPSPVVERVYYLLRSLTKHLESCIQYRGHSMPMVSCLLRKGTPPVAPRFLSLGSDDYELLVTAEDTGAVFACPADRMQELRLQNTRKLAARKAVETRRLREAKQPQLRLVDASPKLPAITDQTSSADWQHGSHIDSMPTQQPQTLAELKRLWESASGDDRAEFWKYLHQLYINEKRIRLSAPDVVARAALISEINQEHTQKPA